LEIKEFCPKAIINDNFIKDKIHTIRGKQVILDRDIALLYGVETGHLNRAVKRNQKRFPNNFCFNITKIEFENLKCQNGISSFDNINKWGGRRNQPLVFTEHGVSMLSSILRSDKAIEISIKIIEIFISMRKFLIQNKNILNKFQQIDQKFIEHDKNFEKVFDYMALNEPTQGIFFNGQIFDAYIFVSKLIKKAKKEIILIDNYIDEEILEIFTKTKVNVKIYSKNILNLDIEKVKKQYNNIKIIKFDKSHDRFLIIDNETYHLGASLKDLGKKLFGFSKLEDKEIIKKLQKIIE
jgi:hypothetical protein